MFNKEELFTSMLDSANLRKHIMILIKEEKIGDRSIAIWKCEYCERKAVTDTCPPPNGIEIFGEAVAIDCEGPKPHAYLKVINKVKLTEGEESSVELTEALFFYHSYIRTELEIVEIAHDILSYHADSGNNSNYLETSLCHEVEKLIENQDNDHEWIHETVNELSEFISDIYGIDGYSCGYHEGDWGMFPHAWDC